jgi:tryptophan synthase alpha subunit
VTAALAAGAAGVICGSAIVAHIAAGEAETLPQFVAEMKAATVRRRAA